MNFERVNYYQAAIRNIKLFPDEASAALQSEVSSQQYQVDLMEIHNERIYV